MISADELVERVPGLRLEEVRHWVAQRWVVPQRVDGGEGFAEIDVARVILIKDLRTELKVDDEALPMLLSLIDQVYSLRRDLRLMCRAVQAQPDEVSRSIRRYIEDHRR